MKKVQLYTDGACSYNPGPGGYGIVLLYKGNKKEFSGFEEQTTNNRMELTAVIEGLRKLKEKCDVTVYTDSAYVMNAINNKWIENWQINEWKTAAKKPVQNRELWERLLEELGKHKVSWVKVKGHSDNELNNLCDKLATGEIAKRVKKENELEKPKKRDDKVDKMQKLKPENKKNK